MDTITENMEASDKNDEEKDFTALYYNNGINWCDFNRSGQHWRHQICTNWLSIAVLHLRFNGVGSYIPWTHWQEIRSGVQMRNESKWSGQIMNNLREHRTRHELTQEELAKRLGITRQTVIAMEKGNYNPSLELAFKIARVFDVKIEDIFLYTVEAIE